VSPGHVRVEIVVEEGPPTRTRAVRIEGLEGLPPEMADGVRAAAARALPAGGRFDEELYAHSKDAVSRSLTDEGYAYATVASDAQIDLVAHAVDYRFTVKPGPSAVFGPITFVIDDEGGKGPTIQEAPLRRSLNLKPGHPYSTAAIDTATQALFDLEVLSSVQIVPTLSDPPQRVVPLTVRVQPTKLRSIRAGGGLEFDEIKTELHGLVGWEHHDFLGDLRDFSVDFKPGVVLYPTRLASPIVAPTAWLPEERLRFQLRQPAFVEARTTGFVRPELNVFPMLVSANTPDPASPVLGYVEPKGTVGVDRRFGKHVFVTVGHNLQGEIPFAYPFVQTDHLTSPLPSVVLSVIQIQGSLDFRDDRVHPHAGVYLSSDLQFAGGPLLGSANDIRWQPEVRGYVPIARGVTLAARSSVGMLFASNYGVYVHGGLPTPVPNAGQSLYETVDRDIEITLFRGFFSGGPSSNRGYPVRGIAPHGVVPFLSPATQTSLSGKGPTCVPGNFSQDCAVSIGGFSLWEASVELRFAFNGPLGFALFCDSGDVAAKEVEFRFDHLHLSCGAGARLDTPVGPIRLDVGYRFPFAQVLGFSTEGDAANHDHTEGSQPWLFGFGGHPGVPMAISFGIGETY
jgi:outer membrane translocation and assembly module TamA